MNVRQADPLVTAWLLCTLLMLESHTDKKYCAVKPARFAAQSHAILDKGRENKPEHLNQISAKFGSLRVVWNFTDDVKQRKQER